MQVPSARQVPQTTGYAAINAHTSGPQMPPLTPESANNYARLFDRAGAQGGLLQGDVARMAFERSGLPSEVLAHVWALADREQRGALDVTEFIIAMHLLASYKAKTLTILPPSVPVALYETAARRGLSVRPASARGADLGPIPRQSSGSGLMRGPVPRQFTPGDWLIGDREKASYDVQFDKVDTGKLGIITGDQAVTFFSDSGLPSEILAQIWELSNVRKQDTLNRDEFAVAMFLIKTQRGKRVFDLPQELPTNLIPPSLRGVTHAAPTQYTPQAPVPIKSAAEDLFGLDALTSSPVASVPQQTTGGSLPRNIEDPFAPKTESPRGASFASPGQQTFFKSFAPTSTFGQSIVAQSTGASGSGSGAASISARQPAAMEDLLGDNDPEISKKLTKDTSDLGNMSNELGTLRTQMQDVQNKRAVTDAELNNSGQQKREMEQRLGLIRTQFEQARQALNESQEKLGIERGEVAKLGQQLTLVDAQAQDVRTKYTEAQGQLQAVQREREGLKDRLKQLNDYVAQTQPEIDRLQAELRHQRGMLAITKKQAEKAEEEKAQLDKLRAETAELTEQARSQSQSPEAGRPPVAREMTGASISSAVSSPSMASTSTNPFMRRSPQQSIDSTTTPGGSTRNQFDSIFSTAFNPPPTGGASSHGPPPTSFGSHSVTQSQPSGPSVRSSEPEVPTPSTSPPLSSTYQNSPQLPPPPASRQITSKDLPLEGGDQAKRALAGDVESVATSVRVETPLSRYDGQSHTPTGPSIGSDRPETGKSGHAPVGSKGDIEAAFASVGKVSRQNTRGLEDSFHVGAGGDDVSKFNTDFPPIGTGEPGPILVKGKKTDEFPPIKSLEIEDDSDSDAGGFEDDFTKMSPPPTAPIPSISGTSASPTQAKGKPFAGDIFAEPSHNEDLFGSKAATGGAPSTSTLSSPIVQSSPPSFPSLKSLPPLPRSESGSAITARGESPFDRLQSQNRASNAPSEATFASAASHLSPASTGNGNGSANGSALETFSAAESESTHRDADLTPRLVAETSKAVETEPVPPPKGKSPFDAFDSSAFAGLSAAKEVDSSDHRLDDDLLMFGGAPGAPGSHASHDEFTAAFDAPPPVVPSKDVLPIGGKKPNFDDAFNMSFSEFDNNFAGSLGQPGNANTATTAMAASTTSAKTDWDALMKGFDDIPPAKEAAGSSNKKFSFEAEDGDHFGMPSGSIPPAAPMPPPAPEPPTLGRTVSQSTEHDDPILKHLMGMGYSRPKALGALEKFDYDISKVNLSFSVSLQID
jgi:epidermal growth factor receptor substrate 15